MRTTEDANSGFDQQPEAAFSSLGNEVRLAIIQALWDAYDPLKEDHAVAFSTLYDRVDIDDTGNFNYHLKQLLGRFVRQSDDGYVLTQRGFTVATSIVAGSVEEGPTIEPRTIDAACPQCDAPVAAGYDGEHVEATCTACDGLWQLDGEAVLFRFTFPPAGLLERTIEEIFHATIAHHFHAVAAYLDGVCSVCGGKVERAIDICDDHEPEPATACPTCGRNHRVEIFAGCSHCKSGTRGPTAMAVFTLPVVTSFYAERGAEHGFATWEAFRRGQTVTEEVLEIDPLRLRITVPSDGDRLHVLVDDDLTVLETEID